jgi:hypothetical protein
MKTRKGDSGGRIACNEFTVQTSNSEVPHIPSKKSLRMEMHLLALITYRMPFIRFVIRGFIKW